jgi:hypothetical protein
MAMVTRNDDGYCDVVWSQRGVTHTGGVDCDRERPGDPREVLALPAPLRGEVVDVAYSWGYVLVIGAVLAAPLAVASVGRLRERRRTSDVPPLPGLVVAAEPPPRLGALDLGYDSVAEVVERRAAVESWYDAPRQRWWSRVPATPEGRLRRAAAITALWPAFVLGIVALMNVPTLDNATSAVPTRDAQGTVTSVHEGVPFMPDEVVVVYEVGATVAVRYDPDDPSNARLTHHDGTARGLRVLTVAGVVAGAVVAFGLLRMLRGLSRLRRLRASAPRTMRYAVARGGAGAFGLLLFGPSGDEPPEYFVPMGARLPTDLRLTGAAEVRGLADGEHPLVTAGPTEVYPPDPAALVDDPEGLPAWVNGDDPFDDEGPASL